MNNGKALIIQPALPETGKKRRFIPSLEDRVEEAKGLAHAIFLEVAGVKTSHVRRPSPGYLLGKGTRAEIAAMVQELKPDLVIVNHTLTPVQQRNLEKEWQAKVIDRTGLILEIFAARAQTKEGQIQVDLALLEYQRSRLVRSWTHLERQRGARGKMGGPGEMQIEIDRRLIGDRITKLKKDLEQVRRNRDLQRKSRERVPYPVVALVGYTNAGKSTLFNRLTGASVFAEDLLFATLDPTMRRVTLENGQDVILSDTVGFIADLPTHLVAAFRATLEQVQHADVILHVRDAARPDSEAQKEDVIAILGDLGIEYDTDPRIVEVLNKIDLLDEEAHGDILRRDRFTPNAVALSALTGEGTDSLLNHIEKLVSRHRQAVTFAIPPSDGQAAAWLYDHGHVLQRTDEPDYIYLTVTLEPANIGRFRDKFSYSPLAGEPDAEEQVHGRQHRS